jgi:peptidoglycan/LPS O-acetylase OafA/YrhL
MWHEPVPRYLDAHHALSHRATAFPWVALLLVISVPFGWLSYSILEKPAAQLGALLRPDGRPRSYYGPSNAG